MNNNKPRKKVEEKDAKDMLNHLEDEYRKANISEKDYKSLKDKYTNRLNNVNNMPKKDKEKKEEEIEEVTPEVIERLATQLSQQAETEEKEDKENKEKKSGFFSKLFGGKRKEIVEQPKEKEEKVPVEQPTEKQEDPETQTYEEPEEIETKPRTSESVKRIDGLEVELEKLKTILETVRETGHITDETIQGISESIGELRSLIFQTDANLKETMVKMERIEDDVNEVKPKEIAKKFRDVDAGIEKHSIEIEKIQTKLEDSNEKLNKMYEMLKSISGIENLVDINKKIQEKLKDVDEAVKYIGRIGAKTEKQFIDLSRGLDDLILFKAKQEDLDESLKEIVKSIDALNVKFEAYVSKKDLDVFKEDIFLIKKQLENIGKVLPLVDVKLPEEIINLRKEREDILLLLDSLRDQYGSKKITKSEYNNFKEGNEKRLKEIEKELEKEWKKVEKMIKPPGKEKSVEDQIEAEIQLTPVETKIEETKTEKEEVTEVENVKKGMEEVEEIFKKKKGKKEVEEEPKEEKIEEIKPEATEKAEEKKKIEIVKKQKKEIKKIEKKKRMKKIPKKESKKLKILSEIKKMKI